MNAKIAFYLLSLSQLLARIFVAHVLRKHDEATLIPGKLAAVRVLGLIDVLIDPESGAIRDARSELEGSRITFAVDSPSCLVGYVGDTPQVKIELGHGSTLYLLVQTADAVLVRAG
jgi:hypothetical protein